MRLCKAIAVLCLLAVASIAQSQVPTFRTDHYSAADSIHAVAVELNEDGALDFVIGAGQVQLSNGNGTYRSGGTVPGISGFVVASGDFDNDSNADVVFTAGGQSDLQIAYGNGTGDSARLLDMRVSRLIRSRKQWPRISTAMGALISPF